MPKEQYRAPSPYSTLERLGRAAFWIFFPIKILSLGFGRLVGLMVLPAQWANREEIRRTSVSTNEELKKKLIYIEKMRIAGEVSTWNRSATDLPIPRLEKVKLGSREFYPVSIEGGTLLAQLDSLKRSNPNEARFYLTHTQINDVDFLEGLARESVERTGLSFKLVDVHTHDGCKLDTAEFSYNTEVAPEEKRYIINFNGNIGFYQAYRMLRDAIDLESTIIGFNYRGVGLSTGRPYYKNDLINDGIAQVQRLLDGGASPNNIFLKGQSLGGAVATLVAKHFNDRGIKINVFNDRSFSTLTHVVSGWIRSIGSGYSDGHSESIFGIILSYIIWPIIKAVLILSNWEMDAASAYRKLSNKNKFYTLVRSSIEDRSKKTTRPDPVEKIVKRIAERVKDDSVITHYASLHLSVYAKWRQVLYKERFRSLTLSSILLLLSVALFLSFGGALVPVAIAAPVPLLIGFSYAKVIAVASVLLVSLVMVTWAYFERKSKLGLKQKDALYPEGSIEYEENIIDETSPRGVFRASTDKPGKIRDGFAKLEVKAIHTHWGPDCGHNKFLEELLLRDDKTGSTGKHVFGRFFNKDRNGSVSTATATATATALGATLAL